MRKLYVECRTGASGDMLMAALYELLGEDDKQTFLDTMNSSSIEGVEFQAERGESCGISGTHMKITIDGHEELDDHHEDHCHEHTHEDGTTHSHGHDYHHHHHEHDHLHHDHVHHHEHHSPTDVTGIIDRMDLSCNVKDNAKKVYDLIAAAESKAHGKDITEIHFHEVGSKDAIADVVGVCQLMAKLRAEEVIVSPICTGSGYIKCAHGLIPVPAPATAEILKGIPIYAGDIETELCTPTGAALLKHFATGFGQMPEMIVDEIGVGIGTKDLHDRPNCVRVFLGK